MRMRLLILSVLCLLALPALAAPSAEELSAQMKAVSAKVQDMQATMVTTIVSSLLGNKPMVQKATLIKKGESKTRMEMTIPGMGGQPTRIQTTITSGNETWIIGNDGAVQKLADSGERMADRKGADPLKYLEYFTMVVTETTQNYLLTGTPKEDSPLAGNAMFGKIVTTVPKATLAPTLLQIYKPDNSVLMTTTMEYQTINGCLIVTKTVTAMTISGLSGSKAQTMRITVEYKDVAVNQGVEDGVFGVE